MAPGSNRMAIVKREMELKSEPKILVVGGDSRIGRAFIKYQKEKGQFVAGTTRRAANDNTEHLALDVIADNRTPIINKYNLIIIAAGISSQQSCQENKEYAQIINVDGPVMLARNALERGKRVIFLSTNLVVGGEKPFLPVDAPLAPNGAYAKTKAEAECKLLCLPNADKFLTIVRLTKVFDKHNAILADWRNSASKGKQVRAFDDLVVSPTSMAYVVKFLDRLVNREASGVLHCSGATEITYAELARAYLAKLGLDASLIIDTKGRNENFIAAQSPPHSSLGYGRECELLGMQPQKISDLLDDLNEKNIVRR